MKINFGVDIAFIVPNYFKMEKLIFIIWLARSANKSYFGTQVTIIF